MKLSIPIMLIVLCGPSTLHAESCMEYEAALYQYRLAAQASELRVRAFAQVGLGDVYLKDRSAQVPD